MASSRSVGLVCVFFCGLFPISSKLIGQEKQRSSLPALPLVRARQLPAGSEVLFGPGGTLEHFRGYASEEVPGGWVVEDDTLGFAGSESGGGDLVTKHEYGNFELTFDWKVEKGANSGVMYLVSLGDEAPYMSGPEYQILDDEVHSDGKNPLTSAAALYGLYEPKGKELKPVGDWNSAKIVVNQSHVEHWLNGTRVLEAQLGNATWKELVAGSKFATWPKFGANSRGHIVFQDHGDKVWYRSIVVRALGSDSDRK